jgi:hypothetical protein
MGLVQSTVYFNRPSNVGNLRQRIRAEIEQISPDIIERSAQSVGECQIVRGRQFQYLRFIKYDIQGVFLKCAEILPTKLFDNVED